MPVASPYDISSIVFNSTFQYIGVVSVDGVLLEANQAALDFAHIVSHNLRSHTANLTGVIEMLRATHPALSETEEFPYLEKVSNELNSTIKHLNEVAQINLGRP